PEAVSLAAPLLRNGFRHITALCYLRNEQEPSPSWLGTPSRLPLQTYEQADHELFHATLWRPYEETLDRPEAAGVGTLEHLLTEPRRLGPVSFPRFHRVRRARGLPDPVAGSGRRGRQGGPRRSRLSTAGGSSIMPFSNLLPERSRGSRSTAERMSPCSD